MSARPVVLNLIGAFRPGHDATGPNLSVRAMCEGLGDKFDFRLVGRAQTPSDARGWTDRGFAGLINLPVGAFGAIGLSRLLRETPHDLLMLNGFFDREFTIPALIARKLGRAPRVPALLSPRGEFSGGALALKGGRKRAYFAIAKAVDLLDGVALHVTSDPEGADAATALPGVALHHVANFRPLLTPPPFVTRPPGAPLRLAFLGRITPVKGLDIALAALAKVNRPARFDIYGPVADVSYWQRCREQIARLPAHITVQHHGAIANADAPAMLAAHDALLLPSLSENFGHAIFEALACGTPVIIGDRTPWRDLPSAKAGFDCPVGDAACLARAIETLAAMDPTESVAWRAGALARARAHSLSSDAPAQMTALLHELIARGRQ